MKSSNFIKYFFLITSCMLMYSCQKHKTRIAIGNDNTPPGILTNVEVTNKPGGAIIKYSLPDDDNILYAKAKYTLATGAKQSVKATYYSNSLKIQGYADTMEHTVQLYVVNRNEVASEPVEVTIAPLKSPIREVFENLKITATFGGVHIETVNPDRVNVAILLMQKDEYGQWQVERNSIYSSTDSISRTLRGYDTTMHDFAITVRDRWLNYTDTMYASIKPLFETLIPISGYKKMVLPGDAPWHKTTPSGMWDGDFMNWPRIFMTEGTYLEPAVATINLGTVAKLSRIVIWDYPEYYNGRTYYYQGAMKKFQIWGCTSAPAKTPGSGPDGLNMSGWVLLGTYQETKPSGSPYGVQTNEDYQVANAGFSWEIKPDAPKVQYIRIKCLENWGGSQNMAIAEIRVFGQTE